MKILVTGATGFIGNHVIQYLLGQGHCVIATSRSLESAKKKNWFGKVAYVQFDILKINNDENIFDLFDKPDVLIHLAWGGLPNYLDKIHFEENLFFHSKFLSNYIEGGGNHILVAGTCLEYGIQSGCLTEDMIPNPTCSYAMAKDSLRKYLTILQGSKNFVFQWLRLFYMYGDGQNEGAIIPKLQKAIKNGDNVFNMSGGEQLRDYLHVKTIAEYISKVALQYDVSGIINCSSGEPISIRKFVEDYLKENNINIKLNLGYFSYPTYEPMAFWGDCSKIKAIITSK